ncbi:helix-turn-helix transcriptional regulator [Pumilibacter muris]|uniref:helix-turn-helix domain-containing protein n=1 Tax=Pumilibacter muris TaxID=2941510 RepID=UPI0030842FD8
MNKLVELLSKEKSNPKNIFGKLFCVRLKELREEKDLTQAQVALKMGIPVSTFANWEQGRREPSIFDIYNLLWVLEVDANELFGINNDIIL